MENEQKEYQIKVYRIDFASGEFYVGSTKKPRLSQRMAGHRGLAKQGRPSLIYQTMREKEYQFTYGLVASCMVANVDEQRMFEQHWIDELKPTLNTIRAYNTEEQHKLRHKEYYQKPENKLRKKEYRDKPENKQKVKEYRDKPENKLRMKEYRKKPENKLKNKEYAQNAKDSKKHMCYECEKSFCSNSKLEQHNRGKPHNDTYNNMFIECFGK